MYSHKSIDVSFLAPQSTVHNFYNALIKIMTILYHSMHQTPEYISWLDVNATPNCRSILDDISQQILKGLCIDFKIKLIDYDLMLYKNDDAFLCNYKLKDYSAQQPLPNDTTCDIELSKVYNDSSKLCEIINDCNSTFSRLGLESHSDMEQNISALLQKIKRIMKSSNDFKYKIYKINQYVDDINDLLDINYNSVVETDEAELIKKIHSLASAIRLHITHMIQTNVDVFNLERINKWCGLIDKMTLDNTKVKLIKEDLEYFLDNTKMYQIIMDNIDRLSSINNQLLFFMKGVDENNPVDYSNLKNCKILNRIGVTFKNPKEINALHLCNIGNLILQSDQVVHHPLLACEFFELAYMYANDKAVKLLGLCQLETAYSIAQRGGYSMGFYDEAHIALYRYIKYIKAFDKPVEILLREIESQIIKFNVDVVKMNLYKHAPNKNLLNILFILEHNNTILIPSLHGNLEKILDPIYKMQASNTLGDCDIEIIKNISIIIPPKHTEYHAKYCCIQ